MSDRFTVMSVVRNATPIVKSDGESVTPIGTSDALSGTATT